MLVFNCFLSWLGEYWKMHRRLLNPTVQNTKILNSFSPYMNERLKVLIDILASKDPNEVFNIYEFLEACTFDVFASKSFRFSPTSNRKYVFIRPRTLQKIHSASI